MRLLVALVLLVFSALTDPLWAATYYVGKSGTTAFSGSVQFH